MYVPYNESGHQKYCLYDAKDKESSILFFPLLVYTCLTGTEKILPITMSSPIQFEDILHGPPGIPV